MITKNLRDFSRKWNSTRSCAAFPKRKQKPISFEIIDGDRELELNADAYLVVEVFGDNYFRGELLGMGMLIGEKSYFFTKTAVLKNRSLHSFLANPKHSKKPLIIRNYTLC